jgi:hypothetical protein
MLTPNCSTTQDSYRMLDTFGVGIDGALSGATMLLYLTSCTDTSRCKSRHVSQPTPPPPGLADHFPVSCQHMFGPLPNPPLHSPALDSGIQFPQSYLLWAGPHRSHSDHVYRCFASHVIFPLFPRQPVTTGERSSSKEGPRSSAGKGAIKNGE